MMTIEEEKNEAPDDKRPKQKEIAALEKWKQEEFGRWKDVFPKMKYGEIWKEVDILEKWRQEKLDKIKKILHRLSDEEISEILEEDVLKKGTTKRLRKLLIGEDIKKMSEQLDEVLEREQSSFSSDKAERHEIYEDRKKKFEAEIKAVDKSQPFASIEKNQYRILEKLEEMFLGSFNSSLEVEERLRLLNHSSLKSQLPLISVLREMKENTREMKENSHPGRQFVWILGAGTISGLVVGFVVEDNFSWIEFVVALLIVSVVLFLLISLFKQSFRSWARRFVAKLRLLD